MRFIAAWAVREDSVQKVGTSMLFLAAIAWFSVGGCQRQVVSSPQPPWQVGRAPTAPLPIPLPREITPQAGLPPLIGGNPWKPTAKLRDWKHIVIHHTASENGSIESIHEAHLKNTDKNGKHWLGIGYHFVIGNGRGMSDGEIEPTFRWKQQMQGAHAGNDEYNQHGIGVCLVGNFEDHAPSSKQLASVKKLIGVLKREYKIPSKEIVGHREVKKTECPGKLFPLTEVAQSEDLPGFVRFVDEFSPEIVRAQGSPLE